LEWLDTFAGQNMTISREAVAGPLIVASIVAAGLWYANAPLQIPWSRTNSHAAALTERSSPAALIRDARWTSEGLIAVGSLGPCGPLFVHDSGAQSSRLLTDAGAGTISCVAQAADGHHVVAGTFDGRLWWIDRTAPAPPRLLVKSPQLAITVTTTDDAGLIAAGTIAGSIYVCDLSTGTTHVLSNDRESSVADLRFSSDRKLLASAQNDGSVRLWDLAAETALPDFAHHDYAARAVAFLQDGKRLISAGLDDTVRIWDPTRGEEMWREGAGMGGVNALAVSPVGSTAAWGGFDHTIVVWNLDCDQIAFEIYCRFSVVRQLKFSPDGSFLLAEGGTDSVCQYDLQRQGEESHISLVPPSGLLRNSVVPRAESSQTGK
jgi:WD40 repeat protein